MEQYTMSVKLIANFNILMRLAKDLGNAKKTGNLELIKKAQKNHDDYKEICLQSDEIQTGYTLGDLDNIMNGR